jgi:hypothetical protein
MAISEKAACFVNLLKRDAACAAWQVMFTDTFGSTDTLVQ